MEVTTITEQGEGQSYTTGTYPTLIAPGLVFVFSPSNEFWSPSIIFSNGAVDCTFKHLKKKKIGLYTFTYIYHQLKVDIFQNERACLSLLADKGLNINAENMSTNRKQMILTNFFTRKQ